ncbi:MAG: hypothetical protein QW328_09855 [Nitrososphaerota archaeon]
MFAYHGPVLTEPRYGNPRTHVHIAGDKILVYRRDTNKFSLCDSNFNEITNVENAIGGIHYLAVHRSNVVEYYSGAFLGLRCPDGSELLRYMYGSNTVEGICPAESYTEAMLSEVYYDAVTKKLIIGTYGYGNKILVFDTNSGEFTKLSARNASSTSHLHVNVIVHDDTYVYVLIKKMPEDTGSFEIRRYRVDELLSITSGHIEDYGEQILFEEPSSKAFAGFTMTTLAPNRRTIQIVENPWGGKHFYILIPRYEYDPVSSTFFDISEPTLEFGVHKRYFGKYALSFTYDSIRVLDLDTLSLVQELPFIENRYECGLAMTEAVDPIFVPLCDRNNRYIYLLTYNSRAPVIEYDHINRKIRIVDFITKEPLSGELWMWRSRFCYPRDAFPLGIQPETITVSDWTPIPSASSSECLTFAIKEVIG